MNKFFIIFEIIQIMYIFIIAYLKLMLRFIIFSILKNIKY